MPIYEYVCKACGRETEIIHGISEPAPKKCPNCGKPQLSKLVSAAGFRLKGGGWYETDFKSGAKKDAAGKAGESPADGAKSDAKSDTTPGVIAPKAGVRPAPKSAAKSRTAAAPAKKPARKAAKKRPAKPAVAKKSARTGKGGRKR